MDTPDLEGLFDEHGVPIFEGGDSFDISDMKGIIYNDAEIDSAIPLIESSLVQEAKQVTTKSVRPFRDMLGKANARGMSALEQTMDLMADISHGAKTGNATGAIGDFIPQTMSNLKPVVQNIKNHSTSQNIIKNMKVAQNLVKDTNYYKSVSKSKGQQIALGASVLAGIGVASNRKLKERRG
jgi:hypothetical protein